MPVIYEPKGRAKEYSDLALNLYTGCSHGCLYCYAPDAMFKKREQFHSDVVPRGDILNLIKKEAPAYTGKEVFLCFSCDPYCPEELEHKITRQAIEILHASDVGVNILTKGGMWAARDFDLLEVKPECSRIGATLTFWKSVDSFTWEPRAAHPLDRLRMLESAHKKGIPTWASLEPVVDPNQSLELIRMSHRFVDHYKVGRWNHDKRAKEINWARFLQDVTSLLDELGKSYYIKKDLAVFSERGME